MKPEIMIADRTYHNAEAPNPRSLSLENIAIALGNTCRWGGHLGSVKENLKFRQARRVQDFVVDQIITTNFYSVAEHSVLGAKYYMHNEEPDLARLFLLHDALEPFVGGDIPTPLKAYLAPVKEWETKGQEVLIDAYNLEGSFEDIKEVDMRICRNEVIALYDDEPQWSKEIEPLYYVTGWDRKLIRLEMWNSNTAANEWYSLAKKLGLENKYDT